MNTGQLLRPRQANKPFLLEASPNSIVKETACTSSQLKSKSARPTKDPVQKVKSHFRSSPTIEANSQPPSSSSKAAGFARFLQEHSSPQHQRVTAGGRIVPVKCTKMSAHSDEQIPSQAQNVAGEAMEEPSANTFHPGGAQYEPAAAQNVQFPFIVGGSQPPDSPIRPPPGFVPAGDGTVPIASLFTTLPESNMCLFAWPTYPFPGHTAAESGGLVLPFPARAAHINENALEVLNNMFRYPPGHCVVPLSDVKIVLQTLYLSLVNIWYADRWMAIQGAMRGLINMCDTTLDLVNAAAASKDQTESFHVSLRYYYINLRMLFWAFYESLTDELQRRVGLPPTVPRGHPGAFGSEPFSSGDISAETMINVVNRVPLPEWLSAPYHFDGPLFTGDHDAEEEPLPGSPSPVDEDLATIDQDKDAILKALGALSTHDQGSTAEGATRLNPEAPAWKEVAVSDPVVEGVEPLEHGHIRGGKSRESALSGQYDGASGSMFVGLRFARQTSQTPSGHSRSVSSGTQPLLPADEVVGDTDGPSVLSPTTSVSSGSSGLAEGEGVAAGLRIDEPEVMSRGAGETETISQSVRDALGPMPPKGEAIGVEKSLSAVDEGRQASEGDVPGADMHRDEPRRPNQCVFTIQRNLPV